MTGYFPFNGLEDAVKRLAGEYIYFMYCAKRVKIGYSKSLARRMVKMLTDMPHSPHLIHLEPGTMKQERLLHREFADLRVQGEWFSADERIYDHIRQRRAILNMPEFVHPKEDE